MFRVVVPHEWTMSATNVAANSEAEWASGTTYDLDDLVQVTDISVHKVYKSLRGNNTNRYPPDHTETLVESGTSASSISVGTGSKTITTQAGKGFSLGMVVKIAKTVTPNTVNMTAEITAYDSVTGSMTVSVYSVTGSGTHSGWTITTEDEIAFWEEVSATNQHAMIDDYVNTKTSNLNSIEVKFAIEKSDTLVLFGLFGASLEVKLWNDAETELVWSDSFDLVYDSITVLSITDWFEYFFGEFATKSEIVVEFGVVVSSGVLEVIITVDDGLVAECSGVVIGRSFSLGETQFGLKLGVQDFSIKETDEQGRTKLEPGYWSKLMTAQTFIDKDLVDIVYKKVAALSGIPTAWIADSDYQSSVVYGSFRDFGVVVDGPTHSFCDIEIEGLT